jgi:RNA recognition motif-containing protein
MATRVYIGRLARDARERDVEKLFRNYGTIREIKLMNGFGFVEFRDHRDADDVVYAFNGKSFMGEKLIVEYARGERRRRDRDDRRDRDRDDRRDRDRDRDDRRRDDRDRDRGRHVATQSWKLLFLFPILEFSLCIEFFLFVCFIYHMYHQLNDVLFLFFLIL